MDQPYAAVYSEPKTKWMLIRKRIGLLSAPISEAWCAVSFQTHNLIIYSNTPKKLKTYGVLRCALNTLRLLHTLLKKLLHPKQQISQPTYSLLRLGFTAAQMG
jgi:hypothetical protein